MRARSDRGAPQVATSAGREIVLTGVRAALLLLAAAYRTVYGVASLAVSIVGAVATWNKGLA